MGDTKRWRLEVLEASFAPESAAISFCVVAALRVCKMEEAVVRLIAVLLPVIRMGMAVH